MINKICICDDNVDYLIELEFLVEDIFKEIRRFCSIETFFSSVDLKNYLSINGHKIDILILDIEMPEINGIEIGEFIWDNKLDIALIYLTNHTKYSLKAYDTFPFHYLIKPVTKTKLSKILSLAIKKSNDVEKANHRLLLKFNHVDFIVNIEDIMYIVKQGNTCIFKGLYHEYKSYVTLIETSQMVSKTGYVSFIQCHQSYLVNLKWVWKWEKEYFILSNGTRIPISRRYKKICEKNFKDYFEDKICD